MLPYLYKLYMVCTTNNYSCPNIYVSSISIPCIHYKIAVQLTRFLTLSVKIEEGELDLFFYFLFLEQLGLGLIGHAVTSITCWHSHKTDHEIWENLVEDSRIDDVIQHGLHMVV